MRHYRNDHSYINCGFTALVYTCKRGRKILLLLKKSFYKSQHEDTLLRTETGPRKALNA